MGYDPGRGTATGEGDLGGLGWGAEIYENSLSVKINEGPLTIKFLLTVKFA